jgi:hypothetical protein
MHLAVYYDIRTATFDKRKVVPPFATLQGLISDLESIREVGTFDLAFEVFDVSTEDPLFQSRCRDWIANLPSSFGNAR